MIPNAKRSRTVNVRVLVLAFGMFGALSTDAVSRDKTGKQATPNIVWISIEDTSPDFGCYGKADAKTPVIDQFAREGVRFNRCFTHAGVCAPSRSGIITGMYPVSVGTHHMRCQGVPPAEVRCFTETLRSAGYYCTNQSKTDYQFEPPAAAWDESSPKAHWRNRAPNQPFFAVFNFTTTHESQIRNPGLQTKQLLSKLPIASRHDPLSVILPPYYPDTPAVRRDWANYQDLLSAVEFQIKQVLQELEQDGLAENTIVWFWGDHGRGLSRAKRWVYDSGIHAPLIIRVPEAWRSYAGAGKSELQPGSTNDELVAFVDFAPTVLSLAGVTPDAHLQGQAFLGKASAKVARREYIYAARDRMDERYDVIRAVRDKRYKYIRNFLPQTPYSQHIVYMDQMPTMREWRRLDRENALTGPSRLFFAPEKPADELYDTLLDPHEVSNLAADPRYGAVMDRMRVALRTWMIGVSDVGLIPEAMLDSVKRPKDEYRLTKPPVITAIRADSATGRRTVVELGSATPGAVLAYRTGAEEGPKKAAWSIYRSPLLLAHSEKLRVKAERIGYRESAVVTWNVSPDLPLTRLEPDADEHWRGILLAPGILEAIMDYKEYDRKGGPPWPLTEAALDSENPALRYWAVRGLEPLAVRRRGNIPKSVLERIERRRIGDSASSVRIAAARVLIQLYDPATMPNSALHLKTLTDHLAGGIESERLEAALALDELDLSALPVVDHLKKARNDPSNYVRRVMAQALFELRVTAESPRENP